MVLTVSVRAAEVLGAKVESPPYVAVTECEPTLSELIVRLAEPELTAPWPSEVPESKKVTVPVAVEGLTEADKVSDWPYVAGLADADKATAVAVRGACVMVKV